MFLLLMVEEEFFTDDDGLIPWLYVLGFLFFFVDDSFFCSSYLLYCVMVVLDFKMISENEMQFNFETSIDNIGLEGKRDMTL